MSSIKDEEMSKNSSHEEPDLENQLSQQNTNSSNNEDDNEGNNEDNNNEENENNNDTPVENPEFKEGDKIEANYRGRGRWYPGKITRKCLDGTYDIGYDDGEKESSVIPECIRVIPDKDNITITIRNNNTPKFKQDDKIEANYKGLGIWYPGKIFVVNRNGTYYIKYDKPIKNSNGTVESRPRELYVNEDCIRSISKNDDDISELSNENWEDALRDFDPSDSSVTGVNRQKFEVENPYEDNSGREQMHTKSNEIKELGITERKEQEFYNHHKKIFDKNSNKSGHITLKQFNNLLKNEFEYNNNYSDPEKSTINNIVLDKYVQEHMNQLGTYQNISFLDYFSVVKHMNFIYENNKNSLLDISKKFTDRKIEQETLRNKEDTLRTKEYELDIIEKQRDIDVRKQMLTINENIKIYTPEKYNKSCCNFLLNMTKQNVIDDFDKIYEIITNLPSLNSYEKNIILTRFHSILTYCTNNYNSVSKLYNSTQIFLIACSIINPALLSINSDKNNIHYDTIFWTVWISQLLVSLITGYIGLFKWDKKYFLFNAYKTKINQEIWRFIALTGKNYKSENNPYDHSGHLSVFLNRLESFYCQLKISEFEIENTKDEDDNADNKTGNGKSINVKQEAVNLMQSRQANNNLQSENTHLKQMRNNMEDENRRLRTHVRRLENARQEEY